MRAIHAAQPSMAIVKRLRAGLGIIGMFTLSLTLNGCGVDSSKPAPISASVSIAADAMAARASVAAASSFPAWKKVSLGGGGAITSMVVHPKVQNLAYMSTDVGGCERWDGVAQTWTPMFDWVKASENNLYGCESIAVDPTDLTGNTVYAAVGKYAYSTYQKGEVMKSVDRGVTWTRSSTKVWTASNWDQLHAQRLAVDPANGQVVYHASREGLFRTTDGGTTWAKLASAPTGDISGVNTENTDSGITMVIIDPSGGTLSGPVRSKNVYISAYGTGLYKTNNGGTSWSFVTGSPVDIDQAAVKSDGTLYVTSPTGVFKYSTAGVWTNVQPISGTAYHSIGIDPFNNNRIVVTEQFWGFYNRMWRSDNSGTSWTETSTNDTQTFNPTWYPTDHVRAAVFSVAFDPFTQNRMWYTDWYMPWRTENIGANAVAFTSYTKGHEELVNVGALVSPPSGATKLYIGVADEGGFAISDVTVSPSANVWGLGLTQGLNVTGADFQETNPNIVALVTVNQWTNPGKFGISTNGGTSFTTKNAPTASSLGGRVAVGSGVISGETNARIVWATGNGKIYYTKTLGNSWTAATGAPTSGTGGIFSWDQQLAADRVNSSYFYFYSAGKMYRSTNGGAAWSVANSTLPTSSQYVNVEAAPGIAQTVWVSFGDNGLYKSSNGGTSFTQVTNVNKAALFSFGKPAAGSSTPSVFVYGTVNNVEGVFRSDDMGANWVQIGDNSIAGNQPNQMRGDRQVYGRVYIGTNGSGVYYGGI